MSKFKPKIITLFGLVIVSISALIGGGFYFANQTKQNAKASSNITLMPGEKALFKFEYSNQGDNTDPVSSLLNIYIGDKLEVDTNTFIDQFDNGTKNCISPSLFQTTGSAKFNWGYLLAYRPRSATNGSSNCNGEATAGLADLGNFGLKKGYVSFEAKLRSTNSDPDGTYLNSNTNQGARATLNYEDKQVTTEIAIMVAKKPVASTPTSAPIPPPVSSAPVNKVITPNDLDTAYCLPDPLTIGQKTICYFRLRDQAAIYTLPDGTKSGITTGSGTSDNCSLVVINNVKLVECRNTPSDSGTPGSQKIRITINNQTDDTKGSIMLVQTGAQTIRNGRLYFVGLDNKQLNWDESVRYNLNYPINQKFKDGNVKLVYDQIGDDINNPSNLWTTGKCNFILSAHTITTTYRSYQGDIVGGKCEANYPVADQTTYNYTHVVVRATKEGSNKIITDTNILVLYVGKSPVILGEIDLGKP